MHSVIVISISAVIGAVVGLAIGDLGGKKNGPIGGLLGALLGPIGWIIVATLPPEAAKSKTPQQGGMDMKPWAILGAVLLGILGLGVAFVASL